MQIHKFLVSEKSLGSNFLEFRESFLFSIQAPAADKKLTSAASAKVGERQRMSEIWQGKKKKVPRGLARETILQEFMQTLLAE